jgi:hypothetical protein
MRLACRLAGSAVSRFSRTGSAILCRLASPPADRTFDEVAKGIEEFWLDGPITA